MLIFILFSLCFSSVLQGTPAELIDAVEFKQFCYPEQLKNSHRACECSLFVRDEELTPWQQQGLRIDCSYKRFKETDLATNLPINAHLLDLSWNALTMIPKLFSDDLSTYSLMHNNITVIKSNNFANLPNLKRIYLDWNSIQTIESGAFKVLKKLEVLDISHNNVHNLESLIFAPLLSLTILDMGWNRNLAMNTDVEELDFYVYFGLEGHLLSSLNLESCGFSNLVLPENSSLVDLNLSGNQLTRVPKYLPKNLTNLDISGNLLRELLPGDVSGRAHLQELYLDDMPQLEYVAQDSLSNMNAMQQLSLQNCRRLRQFDGYAFGENPVNYANLKYLSFRGSALPTLNGSDSMLFALQNLEVLDLYGMPLQCDCHLTWLKNFAVESNGICIQPSRLRGRRITDIPVSDFDCRAWPNWVYGLVIFCLLIFCCTCIYFIVLCLRPYGAVKIRNKVGAGSPYARVTIEPNNQEYNHF